MYFLYSMEVIQIKKQSTPEATIYRRAKLWRRQSPPPVEPDIQTEGKPERGNTTYYCKIILSRESVPGGGSSN